MGVAKQSSCELVTTDALLSPQTQGRTTRNKRCEPLGRAPALEESLPGAPPLGFKQGVGLAGAEPLRREPLWIAGVRQ